MINRFFPQVVHSFSGVVSTRQLPCIHLIILLYFVFLTY
jgi:hypothetical protein